MLAPSALLALPSHMHISTLYRYIWSCTIMRGWANSMSILRGGRALPRRAAADAPLVALALGSAPELNDEDGARAARDTLDAVWLVRREHEGVSLRKEVRFHPRGAANANTTAAIASNNP